jgi:hypothetical protein
MCLLRHVCFVCGRNGAGTTGGSLLNKHCTCTCTPRDPVRMQMRMQIWEGDSAARPGVIVIIHSRVATSALFTAPASVRSVHGMNDHHPSFCTTTCSLPLDSPPQDMTAPHGETSSVSLHVLQVKAAVHRDIDRPCRNPSASFTAPAPHLPHSVTTSHMDQDSSLPEPRPRKALRSDHTISHRPPAEPFWKPDATLEPRAILMHIHRLGCPHPLCPIVGDHGQHLIVSFWTFTDDFEGRCK